MKRVSLHTTKLKKFHFRILGSNFRSLDSLWVLKLYKLVTLRLDGGSVRMFGAYGLRYARPMHVPIRGINELDKIEKIIDQIRHIDRLHIACSQGFRYLRVFDDRMVVMPNRFPGAESTSLKTPPKVKFIRNYRA